MQLFATISLATIVAEHIYFRYKSLWNIGTIIIIYQARALRALGLLLTDGTPTVGGGKTF